MLKGLIRVLLEQEEECCKGVEALFSDAVAKRVSDFKDIILYETSLDLRTEENGESAETMWTNAVAKNEKCEILNALLPIHDTGSLSRAAKERIEEIQLEVCPPPEEGENVGGTKICTDINKSGGHGKSWYKFNYNGVTSDQVRYDYYYMVLDKLGIGMFGPGQEGDCVERIKVWEHEPDRWKGNSEGGSTNQGPTIDWWDGFRLRCDCVPNDSPYKKDNFNIYDLDHPDIKNTNVPTEKTSNSNISNNNTSVNNDNKNQDDGLVNVINTAETNPYEDISFL